MNKISKQMGVTLIEILIVLATIAVVAILIGSLPNAISSVTKSSHRSIAKDIAGKQINYLRQVGYTNLTDGTVPFTDSGMERLYGSSGYHQIEDCPDEICPNNELIKLIKVVVNWREGSASESVQLTTLVASGGIGQ
jgi:type II secretory pathway pseudopilin PulG